MKENVYNKRLQILCEFLQTITNHPEQGQYKIVRLAILGENHSTLIDLKYPTWALSCLPQIFNEWEFSRKSGDPVLRNSEEAESNIFDVCDFFALDVPELAIFDLGNNFSLEKFGGKSLVLESTPLDVAFNIQRLIKYRIEHEK